MTAFVITAAQVTPGSKCAKKWALLAEAVSAGQAVTLVGDKLYKSKGDETAALASASGVALASGAADQPIPYAVGGEVIISTGSAVGLPGDIVILSDTAGSLYPSADIQANYTTVMGVLGADGKSIHVAVFASGVQYEP